MRVYHHTNTIRTAHLLAHPIRRVGGHFLRIEIFFGRRRHVVFGRCRADSLRSGTRYHSLQVVQRYNAELIKAGADNIAIAEPTCSLLSPKAFEQMVLPYLQRYTKSLSVPATLHICGRANHLVELMCKTGVNALSLDSPTDITKIKDKVPPDIMILGNLAPVDVLMMKNP